MATNVASKPSSTEKSTTTKSRTAQNVSVQSTASSVVRKFHSSSSDDVSLSGMTGDKSSDKRQHIQVAVRVRPQNDTEKRHGNADVVTVNTTRREVIAREKVNPYTTKTFTYDKVFGPNSTQIEVYKEVVAPILGEVLMGYNCTIFAYGQTGTGKTFTMEGDRTKGHESRLATWETDPLAGIIPRTLHQLFETLTSQEADFTIRVSFVELYNEELFDLLGADNSPSLRLYDDPVRKGSVVVQGLEEVIVRSKEEVYEILERGAQKRATASTLLNAHSSRSHSVFSITLHIRETAVDGEEVLKTGKLYLVDLAGSENIGRSGAVDKRAREAGSINQSLLTLGRVITALVEHARHVPYRESKLTRLLQDSLGGRTKTSIIATISPSACCLEETLSTLDYAFRAKNITNKPEVNQKVTKKVLLKEYAEEIERLRRDLQATRDKCGIYMTAENYESMVQQMSKQEVLIKELEEKLAFVQHESEKVASLFAKTQAEVDMANLKLAKTAAKLQQARAKLMEANSNYLDAIRARDEKQFLLEEQKQKHDILHGQAQELVSIGEKAVQNIDMLHGKVDRTKEIQKRNEQQLDEYRCRVLGRVDEMKVSVNSFSAVQQETVTEQTRQLESLMETAESRYVTVKQSLSKLHEDFESRMMEVATMLQTAKDDFQTRAKSVICQLDNAYKAVETGAEAIFAAQRKSRALVSNHEDESYEQLDLLKETTNEFVGRQFVRDAPTGNTPSRQNSQFRIPKDLARFSPQEKLLQRFRERYEAPEIPFDKSILEDTVNGEVLTDIETENCEQNSRASSRASGLNGHDNVDETERSRNQCEKGAGNRRKRWQQ